MPGNSVNIFSPDKISAIYVAATLFFGWFFIRVKPVALCFKFWLGLIFFVGLALRIYLVWVWPPLQGIDEEAHYHYVQYYTVNGHRPDFLNPMSKGDASYENHQPALYYALSAVVLKTMAPFWSYSDIFLLRLWSVCLSFVLPFIVYVCLLKAVFTKEWMLSFLTLFSLLPSFIFSGSFINNDQLLIFFAALWWGVLISSAGFNKHRLLGGMLTGIASLVKLSGVIFVMAFMASLIKHRFKDRSANIQTTPALYDLLAVLMASSGIVLSLVHNKMTFHTWLPVMNTKSTEVWESWRAFAEHAIVYMIESFWAAGGQFLEHYFFNPLAWVFTSVVLLGFVSYDQKISNVPQGSHFLRGILIFQIVLVLTFGYLHIEAQGRFLFPVNMGIFIFFLKGWSKCTSFIHGESTRFYILFWLFLAYALGFLSFLGSFVLRVDKMV